MGLKAAALHSTNELQLRIGMTGCWQLVYCSGITLRYDLSKIKIKVNCHDVSQSAQGRDKSC